MKKLITATIGVLLALPAMADPLWMYFWWLVG